jgi:tripartite-type tricarboxylate transporter receptor subunit TctC
MFARVPCRMVSKASQLTVKAWLFTAATLMVASAAEYPNRPVRYIVPSAAGSAADTIARLVATELVKQMGQQVVVDNRPGATGSIAYEVLVRSAPDGYTVAHGTTNMPVLRALFPRLTYDPDKDMQRVVQFITAPNLLAVTPSLPVKSVKELIQHARANPGKLFFGSTGNGTSIHLSGKLFKMMTGTNIVHVPYKAVQQALTDMIGGQLHMMFDNMGTMVPTVRAGRLRGLGVTSLKRSSAVPELPTLAESGLPGFEITVWSGFVVPAGVAKPIVARLNAETNIALTVPAVKQKLDSLGYEAVGGTPEQFDAFVKNEVVKWADVIKRSAVKFD